MVTVMQGWPYHALQCNSIKRGGEGGEVVEEEVEEEVEVEREGGGGGGGGDRVVVWV